MYLVDFHEATLILRRTVNAGVSMSVLARLAMGYAILRGLMLTLLTIPWLAGKLRSPETTESERSLAWMVWSRTVLFGAAILVLAFGGRPGAVAWAILADGVLQLFDAVLALARHKSRLAVLPAILCLVDGAAGLALIVILGPA